MSGSRFTCSQDIPSNSEILKPVIAATWMALTEYGYDGSSPSSDPASAVNSEGASTRSRGRSTARTTSQTGLERSGLQSHRSASVKSLESSCNTRFRCGPAPVTLSANCSTSARATLPTL